MTQSRIARWRRDIKRAREARQWRQSDLATKADTSVSTISRIEHGTANPSMAVVERIASELGLDLAMVPKNMTDREEFRKRQALTLARDNVSAFAQLIDRVLQSWVG